MAVWASVAPDAVLRQDGAKLLFLCRLARSGVSSRCPRSLAMRRVLLDETGRARRRLVGRRMRSAKG